MLEKRELTQRAEVTLKQARQIEMLARRRDADTGDVLHALVVMLVNPDGRTARRMDANWEGLRAILSGAQGE